MIKIFKKIFTLIIGISLLLVFVCIAFSAMTASSAPANPKNYSFGIFDIFGSVKKPKNAPNSYVDFEKLDGEIEQVISLKLDKSSTINKIYINISNVYEDFNIKTTYGSYSSASTALNEYSINKLDINKNKDGWICIYEEKEFNASYLKLYFNSKFLLRELIILDKDMNKLAFSINSYIVKDKNNSGSTKIEDTNEEKLKKYNPINDEQDTFKI